MEFRLKNNLVIMIKFYSGKLIFRSKLKVYIQNHLIWDWVEEHNTGWLFL